VPLLDFDPAVVGIASQPFWLFWDDEVTGRRRSHAPDYFARLVDGQALMVDCRPAERIKPRDAVAFAATRRACELVGWQYPAGRCAGAGHGAQTCAGWPVTGIRVTGWPIGLWEALPAEVLDRATTRR
jgi:hypothetical protein